MDKKQSQKTFVKQAKHGFITRNKCLRNYISRLSAIIFDLKNEGFEFETKFVENTTAYGTERDFVYRKMALRLRFLYAKYFQNRYCKTRVIRCIIFSALAEN